MIKSIYELRAYALHDESEFTEGANGWHALDGMAVELEVAEFLHALVRAVKPKLILESGAGKGFGSVAIQLALNENERGKLVTFEPDPNFAAVARKNLAPHATVRQGCSLDWRDDLPDMVFLDSGPQHRVQEIDYWLEKPVFLAIHDAFRFDQLRSTGFLLRTPRGLWFHDARSFPTSATSVPKA